MEFDKSKVFTAFNADEIKVGSKGYFADSKEDLITRVQFESKAYYGTLDKINSHTSDYVYTTNSCAYRYFYLVEEPKEKTKRPCTREELLEMLKKQGLPIIAKRCNDSIYLVDELFYNTCKVNDVQYTYSELCKDYTLLDGTELWVEE